MSLINYAKRIAIAIAILIFIFLGLKGCIVTVWTSPKIQETYSIHDTDGRSISMIFLPQNQTMIWYFDPQKQHIEGLLMRMRGEYGKHFFWRLWHIEGPGIMFGYRIYPQDTKPVHMEIKVLERYMEGLGKPIFPEKGETYYHVLLFDKDSVTFHGTRLLRETTNSEVVNILLNRLGGLQSLK